jgi:hypothetical protein
MVDVMPLSSVEKPGFQQLVSRLAPNMNINGRTFFTELLKTKYIHRRQMLCSELDKVSHASTTVDAWMSHRKSYLGETVHWFDKDTLKRRNAC